MLADLWALLVGLGRHQVLIFEKSMEYTMKKSLLSLALIAGFFAVTNANADNLVYGPIAIVNETASQTAVHLESGVFTDIFDFVGAPLPDSVGSAVGLSVTLGSSDINFTNVILNGVVGTVALFNGQTSFFVSNVAPDIGGNYHLTVFGTAKVGLPLLPPSYLPSANYGVTLNVAAVPEPSSYAMVLAGLGLIGFMSKRRRSL